MQNIYSIHSPPADRILPLVFDSPHSGRVYPDDFDYACPMDMLVRAEDNYVDDLFASVPDYGGTLLLAHFPRTYIDVNRHVDDIDPELIKGRPPETIRPGSRSHAGIGLVRRLVRPGMPLYERKLEFSEITHRIENYYKPYHEALDGLVKDAHYNFGQVWHINCHSMPSSSAGPVAPGGAMFSVAAQPDFVLGDRDGSSCDFRFTHALRDFLKDCGYRVAVNNPYKGVELVRRHGRPNTGHHSIQIEINKALYWNEIKNKKGRNYSALKSDIDKLISFCAAYARDNLTAIAAD